MDNSIGPPPTGRCVGKRYELVKEIGRGGMARVWLARDVDPTLPDRLLAIKEPIHSDAASVSRFYREARVHWLLRDSPFVVHMFGFEHPEEEPPYLVLELMLGGSLKDLLGDYSRFGFDPERLDSGLPRDLALRLAWSASAAITDLHHKDVAHRDLKPSNLLLAQPREQILATGDGTLKLSDLGVVDDDVGVGPDDTHPGGMVGTWQYAAPEYLRLLIDRDVRGRTLDQARQGDVFALGLVLYELWMGAPLYKLLPTSTSSMNSTAQKAQAVLERQEKGLTRLKSPDSKVREDEEFFALLLQMLDRNPATRAPAEEVERRLRGMVKVVPISASTVSAGTAREGTFQKPDRRWIPGVRTLGGVLGLLLLAGGATALWWNDASQRAQQGPPGLEKSQTLSASSALEMSVPSSAGPNPEPDRNSRDLLSGRSAEKGSGGLSNDSVPSDPAGEGATTPEESHRGAQDQSPPNLVHDIHDLPSLTDEDGTFIALLLEGFPAAVKRKARLDPEGRSLCFQDVGGQPITAPVELRYVGHTRNTSVCSGEDPALGGLFQVAGPHTYLVIKGFREMPSWRQEYRRDATIGWAGEDGVVQQILYSRKELRKWIDLQNLVSTQDPGLMYVRPSAWFRNRKDPQSIP